MNKPTFKHICLMHMQQLTNFPYIEKDFDALTDYGLLCKVVEYLNQVIINENVQNENIVALYNAFTELKNYVDNYFDNLDVQDEINNKLDEMVETGEFQEILEEYIETKVDYFYIDENSTFTDIKNAFESNKAKVIEFKKGTYTLTNTIYLTSNTTIYLNDSTLNTNYSDTYGDNLVFFGYPLNSSFTEYNGISNIKFLNGTINMGFALMHNTNIEFNNISFNNTTSHVLQIGGCKDIKINNCNFSGVIIDDVNGERKELIQLERATYEGQPYLDPSSSTYDETGNFNILISNCKFNKGNDITTRYYVAIGHHSSSDEYPYYNENITIENCYFVDSSYSHISGGSFNNLIIKNCTFKLNNTVANHIHVRLRFANKNIKIHDNIFDGGKHGIYQVNIKQCYDIDIYNNKMNLDSSGAIGIGFSAIIGMNIFNNYINSTSNHIGLYSSSNVDIQNIKIYDNIIDNTNIEASRFGILIQTGSNLKIYDNEFIQNSNNYIINKTNATSYYIANNKITSSLESPYSITGNNLDYSNIYNIYRSLYTGDGDTSYSISNEVPSFPFNNFNRLMLRLHKKSNATIYKREIIYAWPLYGKLDSRTTNILMNIDGVIETATFTINSDGTFSFESTNDSIVLRDLQGYNE